MPTWNSNDPREFGWTYPVQDIIDFQFNGHVFYNGVSRRAAGVFTRLLTSLVSVAGFQLHSGSGSGDGDWGYENRDIISGTSLSFHAFGLALDINAPWNPQGLANPAAGPYRVPDIADSISRSLGILWGGDYLFSPKYDRMHFEVHMSPAELAAAGHPVPRPGQFPLGIGQFYGQPGAGPGCHSGYGTDIGDRPEIRMIQHVAGCTADGLYGPLTGRAVTGWQLGHPPLQADGIVGPLTFASMGL
jgi:peptidoglycan hydrolase-like protein with peptidoglycan-binding domain